MSASLPDVRRVLVVDDQFEVLEMLRSMLALISPRCAVLAVPSAEEGLLEMQRTPFDLVITDVRLPGMSGLEMTARVRRLRPQTPVFVITAYTDTAVALAAAEQGATDFFRKPLDMERMVTAVQSVLGSVAAAAPSPVAPTSLAAPRAILQALQTDLGAQGVALATVEGAFVAGLGAAPAADWPTLAAWLAPFARHALRLEQQMETPFQVSFSAHAAPVGALCTLLVGESHQLLLFLPGAAQPALTPKAWRRLRQAAATLQNLLAAPTTAATAETAAAEPAAAVESVAVVESTAAEALSVADAAPASPPAESVDQDPATTAALADLLGVDWVTDMAGAERFWEEALAHEAPAASRAGLSLEEARRRGLLPPDWTPES